MTDSTDIREALVAYAEDEPPMTFSYEQVVIAGRRARRRRRIAAAAAGSLVFVAVTGVVVAALPHIRADPPPLTLDGPSWPALDPAPYCAAAEAEPSTPAIAPTTHVSEKTGYRIRIPTEPADHAADRISCYLAKAVPPLLPGVTYHRSPGAPDGSVALEAYPVRVFDPAQPGETTPPYFSAEAFVSDSKGVGEIGFGAYPATETVEDAVASCDGCDVRSGPQGATVLVHELAEESGYRLVNVWVHRGDTVAFATATNALPAESPPAGEASSTADQEVGRPDPPLTPDQLVELASAPELTLFP